MRRRVLAIATGLIAVGAATVALWPRGSLPPRPAQFAYDRMTSGLSRESTHPSQALSRQVAATGRASRAPWAALAKRARAGDLGWLLAHAGSEPQHGSLSIALAALRPCATVLSKGTEAHQDLALQLAEADAGLRASRRGALKSLFERCKELPQDGSLAIELDRLRALLRTSGDVLYVTQQEALTTLTNADVPRITRQAMLERLLALDDPIVMSTTTGPIARQGSLLEGEVISTAWDGAAYQAAWSLVRCADYGDCGGPGSVEADEDCLYRSQCDYQDRWRRVEQTLPGAMHGRVQDYYDRIRRNLAQGNYSAFGIK